MPFHLIILFLLPLSSLVQLLVKASNTQCFWRTLRNLWSVVLYLRFVMCELWYFQVRLPAILDRSRCHSRCCIWSSRSLRMIISYLRELAISLSSDGTHIQPVLGSLSHIIVKYLSIQYKIIITFNINNEQITMETFFLIIISFW